MKTSTMRILALILALTFCLGMVACNSKTGDTPTTEASAGDTSADKVSEASEAPEASEASEASDEYQPKDGKKIRIGLLQNNRSEPFHQSMYEGMVAACEAAGWELESAVCDGDAMKHIQADESFISRNMDLIVDFGCLPDSGAKEATSAKEAGIPLMTVDVDYGEDAYFFGVNNVVAGNSLAEAAIPLLKEKFEKIDYIVKVSTVAISPTMKVREDSVIDPIIEAFNEVPEDHIVVLDAGTDNVKASSLTRDWLNGNPDATNVLFIATNDDRGYAANAQIIALDRVDDCALVSYNGDPTSREDLKQQADDPSYKSAWVASVAFNPAYYGASIVEYAKEIFAGTAEATSNADVSPLTKENIHDYLKVIGEE